MKGRVSHANQHSGFSFDVPFLAILGGVSGCLVELSLQNNFEVGVDCFPEVTWMMVLSHWFFGPRGSPGQFTRLTRSMDSSLADLCFKRFGGFFIIFKSLGINGSINYHMIRVLITLNKTSHLLRLSRYLHRGPMDGPGLTTPCRFVLDSQLVSVSI